MPKPRALSGVRSRGFDLAHRGKPITQTFCESPEAQVLYRYHCGTCHELQLSAMHALPQKGVLQTDACPRKERS
jgi:hypothetical protein